MTHSMSSQIAFQARDMEAAVSHAQQALLVEPDFWIAYRQLGQAFQQLGRTDQGLEALAEASRLSKGNTKPISITGYTLATIGCTSEARDVLSSLERISQERYVPPYARALVYVGLNDDERVFKWLDEALAVRDVHLIYLPVDPKWDRLRQEPRFIDPLKRCAFVSRSERRPAVVSVVPVRDRNSGSFLSRDS
jgi:tetratricopeptide (TPR) repeat protein